MINAQAKLLEKLCADMALGQLEWIGLRPAHRADVISVQSVEALPDLGLAGDHRATKTPGSARQVTLISREYIQAIEQFLNRDSEHSKTINPASLRRNLVISGMNMNLLRYQRLQIGDVILETSALCHPCSRMNEALGEGGAAAMFGYGGLCAKIIRGGVIQVGDQVKRLSSLEKSSETID